MSKHISDDLLGNARSKQAYGTRMSECMWAALADWLYAGGVKAPAYDCVEARTLCKASIRSAGSNKDLSGVGYGPSSTQVLEQSIPHRWKQRKERVC